MILSSPSYDESALEALNLYDELIGEWKRPNGSILTITDSTVNENSYRLDVDSPTLDTIYFVVYEQSGDMTTYMAVFSSDGNRNGNRMELFYMDDDTQEYVSLGVYRRT